MYICMNMFICICSYIYVNTHIYTDVYINLYVQMIRMMKNFFFFWSFVEMVYEGVLNMYIYILYICMFIYIHTYVFIKISMYVNFDENVKMMKHCIFCYFWG
jgi:hypothetical protein